MLDYYQALEALLANLSHKSVIEKQNLLDATGLVLAEDIAVQYDTPSFDNSAMDGYALGANIEEYHQWQVIERIAAGDSSEHITLAAGQAVQIFTGAPIPEGTATVVQQEHTVIEEGFLKVTKPIKVAQNIRYQGEEFTKGEPLLLAHQRLTPAMIGLLASQGYSEVTVFKPLKIFIYSTGNELIEPNQTLTTGKIYDANRYLLLSWLKRSAYEVIDGGILPDNQLQTEQALQKASKEADVIITSGGVSVGEEDHVKAAIEQLGKLIFWKLAIKPGKPFAWGILGDATVFMLPGNPVASLVTFQQLVIPALRLLSGEAATNIRPVTVMAKATFDINKTQNRREFLRVALQNEDKELWVKLLPNQGSAMLSTCVKANALAEIPADTLVNKNDYLKIYPLDYKV